MGDVRFTEHYDEIRRADEPAKALQEMPDEGVIAALAAASREGDPYLANVLATEAMNRMQRNSTIVRLAGEGLFALDASGRLLHMNPTAEAQVGWRLEEIRGKLLHEMIHDRRPDGEAIRFSDCPLHDTLRSGRTVRVELDAFRRKDGVFFPARYAATPVVRDGEVVGVVMVVQDVTAQQEARKRLVAAHEKIEEQAKTLEALLHATPDLVYLLDRDLRYHYVSRAAAEALGLPREAIIGRRWTDINPSADAIDPFAARVADALDAGKTHGGTLTSTGALGTRRYEYVIAPVPRDAREAELVVVSARDVTERAQLLDALARNESTYRNLYENIPLMYFEADAAGTVRLLNDHGARQLGYTKDELKGSQLRTLFHPDDREDFDERLAALLEGRRDHSQWVARKLTKERRVMWVHESMRMTTDAHGERRILIACKDISAERHAQRLLEGQARVLERIAARKPLEETLREVALVAEDAAEGLYASVLQYDERSDALRPVAAPSLPDSFARAIAGSRAGPCAAAAAKRRRVVAADIENDPRWKDCRQAAAEAGINTCWSTPILTTDGDLLGVFALYHRGSRAPQGEDLQLIDTVTNLARLAFEHHRDESKVRASATRIEGILESITDGFFAVDSEWRFVYVNQQAERLLHRGRDELLGRVVWDEFPEARGSEFWRHYRRTRDEKEPSHFEARYDPLDAWFEVNAYPSAEGGVSVYFRDVTERRRAEEAMRQMNEELERRVRERTEELAQVNRELESFSYSVSHDLRAPLRGINGIAEVLEEDYAQVLDDDGRRMLQHLREEAGRLSQQVHDLLEMARTVGGTLVEEEVDITALARGVAADLQAAEPKRDVRVEVEEGMVGRGDPRLLRIVFENLLGNAWKFTQRTPDARISVRAATDVDGETVYKVEDNGAGFEMAKAPALFRSFQRLHEEKDFAGTGVGLATVRRIVERHGGRVWAKGEPGHGATFYFTL